jgi:hypothetical protein
MPASLRHAGHPVAALLLAAGLVAACTNGGRGTQPTNSPSSSTTTYSAKPAPPDQNVRDVRQAMIYSDGIAHVLEETAAQMICDALSPAEWHQVLGVGVGRTVYGGVSAKCVVSTGALAIELQTVVEALGSSGERIAGRRVRVDDSSGSNRVAAASAAVVPLGEQNIPAQQRVGARPVLHLLARTTDNDQPAPDLLALLRRLLAALLPRLTPTGPATPVQDAAGVLAYTSTDPVAGVAIYDLPRPVQSLVLCTAMLRQTGLTAQSVGVSVNAVSECGTSRPPLFAKVDQFLDPAPESSPYRIAGRPAEERAGIGIVINLLSMSAEHDRTQHLTLRLTNHASSAQLRSWAEKVATAVLTS